MSRAMEKMKALDAALAELRAVEQDRRDTPRLDYYVDSQSERIKKTEEAQASLMLANSKTSTSKPQPTRSRTTSTRSRRRRTT